MFRFKANPTPGLCPVFACRKRPRPGHKLCGMHEKRQWRANNPIRDAWLNLHHHAKQRRIACSLTFQEFETFCQCNAEYIWGKGTTKHCWHLDRIDPAKGYEPGNIQLLTCSENSAKDNRRRWVAHFQQQQQETNNPGPVDCPF